MRIVRLLLSLLMAMALTAPTVKAEPIEISLATATPGGGFPLFGDTAAEVINGREPTIVVRTRTTRGSLENLLLLEQGKVDLALVAGVPAHEALAGIGRPRSPVKIVAAIYSTFGMFAVRRDSIARSWRDLVGQPVAWGTSDSGLTSLSRYVMEGLGLGVDTNFRAIYLVQAGDGSTMVADGRAAALWGGGVGWPNFTRITADGGRLIGFTEDEVAAVHARHPFLQPYTLAAGSYQGQSEPIRSVALWSFMLARADLPDEAVYRIAKALHTGHGELSARLVQARETTLANTKRAVSDPDWLHPGVRRLLQEVSP